MSEILIIGYGNPLRGDDGVGWHVIRELEAMPWNKRIHFLTFHQLTPELAELLSTPKYVIFVDCSIGDSPGKIKRTNLSPVESIQPFHHHITPETLLTISFSIYGQVASAVLYTVGGKSFEFSESLSPVLQNCFPEILRQITSYIHNLDIPPPKESL